MRHGNAAKVSAVVHEEMKRTRALFLLALAGATLALAQDAVTLRRELKADGKEVYKMEADTKSLTDIPQMGEQEMTIKSSLLYTMTTAAPTDGKSDIGATMTDIKVKMEGPMADMMQGGPEIPKEIKFKGSIDTRNRVTDFKVDGKADLMTMMMASTNSFSNFFIEFPEKPVKVGDTWPVVIPKNPLIGNEESTLMARLDGERDGKWVLKMVGDIKINGDMSELMKGQDPTGTGMEMKIKMTGLMKMATEALVDKVTGQTLEVTTALDSDIVTDIENIGIKTTQKSKGTVKLTLQK